MSFYQFILVLFLVFLSFLLGYFLGFLKGKRVIILVYNDEETLFEVLKGVIKNDKD